MQFLINTIILVFIIPTVSLAAALTIARPGRHKDIPSSTVMLGVMILTTIIAIMFYLFIFFVKR